jgi:2-C-methyl-D-erythritol 4-phosphate cytidylyltransferase
MYNEKKVGVIVPAAGKGTRLGGVESKQFLDLRGKPILVHVLQRFQHCPEIDKIVVAVEPVYREKLIQLIDEYRLTKLFRIVDGGTERQDSVKNCLRVLTDAAADIVMVHDAVRPFVTQNTIRSVLKAVQITGAAITGVRVKDTIKIADSNKVIRKTPEREQIWIAQTPQAFTCDLLIRAFEEASKVNFIGTDDASLVERLDVGVMIVEGDYNNIKITTPEDMQIAEFIADRQMSINETD